MMQPVRRRFASEDWFLACLISTSILVQLHLFPQASLGPLGSVENTESINKTGFVALILIILPFQK